MNSLKKKLVARMARFVRREDGLVTVEWVALTAGMVVAAVVIGFTVMQNTAGQASLVGGGISSQNNAIYGANGANLTAAPAPAPGG
jgi:hypothetical protein